MGVTLFLSLHDRYMQGGLEASLRARAEAASQALPSEQDQSAAPSAAPGGTKIAGLHAQAIAGRG